MSENMTRFEEWITQNGGQILGLKGPYEVCKFRGEGNTHTIYYTKKRGMSFSSKDAKAIYRCYQQGHRRRLANRPKTYSRSSRDIKHLIERDGNTCFFCGKEFSDQLKPTLEHFISRSHDGPDHRSNFVLSCNPCNEEASNKTASEKVRMKLKKMSINDLIKFRDRCPS